MKLANVIITNVTTIEIDRPNRGTAWVKNYTRKIDAITPASIHRLARVLNSVDWSLDERERWHESGLGYDCDELDVFSYPPLTSNTHRPGDWLLDMRGLTL